MKLSNGRTVYERTYHGRPGRKSSSVLVELETVQEDGSQDTVFVQEEAKPSGPSFVRWDDPQVIERADAKIKTGLGHIHNALQTYAVNEKDVRTRGEEVKEKIDRIVGLLV